jgi:hypothetical protein
MIVIAAPSRSGLQSLARRGFANGQNKTAARKPGGCFGRISNECFPLLLLLRGRLLFGGRLLRDNFLFGFGHMMFLDGFLVLV